MNECMHDEKLDQMIPEALYSFPFCLFVVFWVFVFLLGVSGPPLEIFCPSAFPDWKSIISERILRTSEERENQGIVVNSVSK